MATTQVALTTPYALYCVHCARPIHQAGLIGSGWSIRPCPDRACRSANDGAWTVMVRLGDVAFLFAIPSRLARELAIRLGGGPPDPGLSAAAGFWWHGPVDERSQ